MIISSQKYLDDEIVSEKRANKDYEVSISPVFKLDGEEFQVVIDGHHSLAAAKLDGVEPDFIECDNNSIDALDEGRIDDFLRQQRLDSDWYDIKTGKDVW